MECKKTKMSVLARNLLESSTQLQRCAQHPKKRLDRLCLEQDCAKRGLICNLCSFSEHSNHTTVPYETFMESVATQMQKPYIANDFAEIS